MPAKRERMRAFGIRQFFYKLNLDLSQIRRYTPGLK